MVTFRRHGILFVTAAVLAADSCRRADVGQPAAACPVPQKTIGQRGKPEIVPSLFVLNSRGATLQEAN